MIVPASLTEPSNAIELDAPGLAQIPVSGQLRRCRRQTPLVAHHARIGHRGLYGAEPVFVEIALGKRLGTPLRSWPVGVVQGQSPAHGKNAASIVCGKPNDRLSSVAKRRFCGMARVESQRHNPSPAKVRPSGIRPSAETPHSCSTVGSSSPNEKHRSGRSKSRSSNMSVERTMQSL